MFKALVKANLKYHKKIQSKFEKTLNTLNEIYFYDHITDFIVIIISVSQCGLINVAHYSHKNFFILLSLAVKAVL